MAQRFDPRVQALVYIFIALSALLVGATAYFGLVFTPVEAMLAAAVFGAIAVVALERQLRRRAEARLERAIEELSRLLSTDAQAGATLSQRVNQLADQQAGKRLDIVEADISVLGTVIRQVAEAVSEIEAVRKPAPAALAEPRSHEHVTYETGALPPEPAPPPRDPAPRIPLEMVRKALAENRLVHHVQPVVILPQRRIFGYDLVPRLMLEDGELAGPEDFLPRHAGGAETLRAIDAAALIEAVTIGRRARSGGQPINLFVQLSRATLTDPGAADRLAAVLDANRAVASALIFRIPAEDWFALTPEDAALLRRGGGLALDHVRSLRLDFADLVAHGVTALRVDAGAFLARPQDFTDFHLSDIASYLTRYEVDLLATGIVSEEQILELLEDGITLVQGPHIAAPGPIRSDLMSERPYSPAQLRRVQR